MLKHSKSLCKHLIQWNAVQFTQSSQRFEHVNKCGIWCAAPHCPLLSEHRTVQDAGDTTTEKSVLSNESFMKSFLNLWEDFNDVKCIVPAENALHNSTGNGVRDRTPPTSHSHRKIFKSSVDCVKNKNLTGNCLEHSPNLSSNVSFSPLV